MKLIVKNKKVFHIGNYSTKSKYYDNSNKLVIGKMKDETAGISTKEFIRLKPKMNSFLADDNSEHKKAKVVNRNVVTIGNNEYKDVLLKNKCIRHWMNTIQAKDHRIATYEISKISLSYFNDKKYIYNTMNMVD